jgi:hypothetical protein
LVIVFQKVTIASLVFFSTALFGAGGPVYIPLDSWVYPALARIADLGFAPDEESLARPWTRAQCSVLVDEAADLTSRRDAKRSYSATANEALKLISALRGECGEHESKSGFATIESLYSRYSQISSAPLRDSYHFGQTFVNDFGRPYGQGANIVDGFSGYAGTGRFSGYFRGEYQQANGSAPYDQQLQTFISAADGVLFKPSSGISSTRRFDTVETYLGVRAGIFDITAGKQALWWGPGGESALHFSNNAEPMYSIRVAQATPILLPGIFRHLGRIRTQFLVGRLSGHQYPPRAFINAQKITFQLSPDFELGFTRSAIFGGVGHPLTAHTIFRSFFSGSSTGGTTYGSATDPGDRRSGFDFRWRLPYLRRYVTVYSDSLADDEPNPLASPRRSAWAPGLYLTQIPGIRHLDLQFETYSTWLYERDAGGAFIYWNDQYRDAYTNDGNLLGSWIGRDARAYTAHSTYWFSAQNKLEASFRQTKTGSNFVPGGGTQTDASLTGSRLFHHELLATVSLQYERYFLPVLGAPRHNIAASLQFTLFPKEWTVSR